MPRLRPTGGIFWRLNSSGNLTAYDVSGNVLATFAGGTLIAAKLLVLLSTNAPITTTTSLTGVATGNYFQVPAAQPGLTNPFGFIVAVTVSNNTAGDGVSISASAASGGVGESGGTADTSNSLIQTFTSTSANATGVVLIAGNSNFIGLAGVVNILFRVVTGGTATITGITGWLSF